MKRRAFLGFLGVSPFAAKAAAENVALELSGANIGLNGGNQPLSSGMPTVVGSDDSKRKSAAWVRSLFQKGLPDWVKTKAKNETSYVQSINPNIGSLRSVSLTNKFQMQKNHQYEKAIQGYLNLEEPNYIAQEKFREKTGWYL